jgi:large subunit ribosomal protein L7e
VGEHSLSDFPSKANLNSFSVNEIAPKPRKILQLLRLLQINNGVFVKATRATQQMLRLVEPYVTYG